MASACRPACAQATPDDVAMLAHELRRRMAAVRVAGEAVALLRDQGLDLTAHARPAPGRGGRPRRSWPPRCSATAGPRPAPSRASRARRGRDGAGGGQDRRRGPRGHRARPGRRPAEVEASPTMLRQAIENLIDNAAAHGGPDGVEVDVRPDPATGQVEVVVADRGGGGRGPQRPRHRAVPGPPVPGRRRRPLLGGATRGRRHPGRAAPAPAAGLGRPAQRRELTSSITLAAMCGGSSS